MPSYNLCDTQREGEGSYRHVILLHSLDPFTCDFICRYNILRAKETALAIHKIPVAIYASYTGRSPLQRRRNETPEVIKVHSWQPEGLRMTIRSKIARYRYGTNLCKPPEW